MPDRSLQEWLDQLGGIAHRSDAIAAGYPPSAVLHSIGAGGVRRVRRYWLATASAPPPLVIAAQATGVLSCISAARHRGWWLPPAAGHDNRTHIRVKPNAASPQDDVVVHWTRQLVPVGPFALVESIEDSLQHIADCTSLEAASVLWESAASKERLSGDYLRHVSWTSPRARQLADSVQGLDDSGLETIFVRRIRRHGVTVRQQIVIAGHPVDVLIGEWLLVQVDGFAHHSSPADRRRDAEHDAELAARGYTVLRFTYGQILHDWPTVTRAVSRALAAGLHRRSRRATFAESE
ncbi:endonuclease domain-containing protein [Microbacterium sp. CFBP9034]|uniref:endonuclease domain-containing protein n=1 Tax=Microbacterium sp. CFBP9034 TaxID=3096540 RepID=UPI002A698E62|nr:DUF559 domain-containing protein [Microbacterium sp. CFBP9034]MDY0910536.1 DUF559 domain-containing protein [Microbacterium sp. CFBP9034]